MSNEEIVEQIQNGINVTQNQELLWNRNHHFVRMLVKRYVGSACNAVDMQDYMQQGFIGLVTAASKFDNSKQVKFLTYTEYHIRLAIFRYNGYNTSTINIPDYIKLRMRRLIIFKREFIEQFKREPQETDIREGLNMSVKSIRFLEKLLLQMRTKSLDAYIVSDSTTELLETIPTDEDIENMVGSSEDHKLLHDLLAKALAELDDSTRLMIMQIYYQGATYQETADTFRLSRQAINERVRKGFYKIIHGEYCKRLETFMWDGFHANPLLWSDYADTEEIDNIECDLLIEVEE